LSFLTQSIPGYFLRRIRNRNQNQNHFRTFCSTLITYSLLPQNTQLSAAFEGGLPPTLSLSALPCHPSPVTSRLLPFGLIPLPVARCPSLVSCHDSRVCGYSAQINPTTLISWTVLPPLPQRLHRASLLLHPQTRLLTGLSRYRLAAAAATLSESTVFGAPSPPPAASCSTRDIPLSISPLRPPTSRSLLRQHPRPQTTPRLRR